MLAGTAAADQIQGLGGVDSLRGEGGDDLLQGGDGNDVLAGGAGIDRLTGGAGADLFVAGPGDGQDIVTDFTIGQDRVLFEGSTFIGSYLDGADTVVLLGPGHSLRLLGLGVAVLGDPSYHGLEGTQPDPYVVTLGDAGANVLTGTGARDNLGGGDNNDILIGGANDDLLIGGAGSDELRGGAGTDYLIGGAGPDYFTAEAGGGIDIVADFEVGVDRLLVSAFGRYDSIVQNGADTVIMVDAAGGVGFRLIGVSAAGITAASFHGLAPPPPTYALQVGTAAADTIMGTDGRDELRGLGGADNLIGDFGDDLLIGGDGEDTLFGNQGNDILTGGADRDVFTSMAGGGQDTITDFTVGLDLIHLNSMGGWTASQDGADAVVVIGSNGDMSFRLIGVQASALTDASFMGFAVPPPPPPPPPGGPGSDRSLYGSAGADTMTGDGRLDSLFGGDGNDTLNGLGGADLLNGGNGNDRLFGGDGDDVLIGSYGQDTLTGGAGADRFVFSFGDGANTIADFQDGLDRIDLSNYGQSYSSIVQLAAGAKVIFGDGGYVILTGVQVSSLSAADFVGLPAPLPADPPKDDWFL